MIGTAEVRCIDLQRQAEQLRLGLDLDPDHPSARVAVSTWRGRMVNEHNSHHVFLGLAAQLESSELEPELAQQAKEFANEEALHGALCGAVVTALGGEALSYAWTPEPIPEHRGVSRLEAVLMNVLSISCLSETVAVSLISAERLQMNRGPLRDLLTRILGDEIGHARFGWTLLGREVPKLRSEQRLRLGRYLTIALRHLDQHERAHIGRGHPDAAGRELGLCDARESLELFHDAQRQVILPRLAELGLRPAT